MLDQTERKHEPHIYLHLRMFSITLNYAPAHTVRSYETALNYTLLRTVQNVQNDVKLRPRSYCAYCTALLPIICDSTHSPRRLWSTASHYALCPRWLEHYKHSWATFLRTDDHLVCPYSQWRQQTETTIFYESSFCVYFRKKIWLRVRQKLNYDVRTTISAIFDVTIADPFRHDCKPHATVLTTSGAIHFTVTLHTTDLPTPPPPPSPLRPFLFIQASSYTPHSQLIAQKVSFLEPHSSHSPIPSTISPQWGSLIIIYHGHWLHTTPWANVTYAMSVHLLRMCDKRPEWRKTTTIPKLAETIQAVVRPKRRLA